MKYFLLIYAAFTLTSCTTVEINSGAENIRIIKLPSDVNRIQAELDTLKKGGCVFIQDISLTTPYTHASLLDENANASLKNEGAALKANVVATAFQNDSRLVKGKAFKCSENFLESLKAADTLL